MRPQLTNGLHGLADFNIRSTNIPWQLRPSNGSQPKRKRAQVQPRRVKLCPGDGR
ncbi:hypothetical protein CGMCC3_g12733 [Colletotrichum fructicola]|nr:uncharacterized protein CGMCC3_g12733 [Colletotrichum fructicola]KAE9571166.1 hypothetical protein CGMCC3_g12733 [Colletotrichum fructicola]